MTKEEIKELIFTTVQVRDADYQEWEDAELLGYKDVSGIQAMFNHLFIAIKKGSEEVVFFKYMRPKPEPKYIPWTVESAPFPCALKRKSWDTGTYILFDVDTQGVSSCSTDQNGASHYIMSFCSLAHPDSEWETRDGQPCGELVRGEE